MTASLDVDIKWLGGMVLSDPVVPDTIVAAIKLVLGSLGVAHCCEPFAAISLQDIMML